MRPALADSVGHRIGRAMPERMALWMAFSAGTFMNPAAQPISAPPGKASSGIDCKPPEVSVRAP